MTSIAEDARFPRRGHPRSLPVAAALVAAVLAASTGHAQYGIPASRSETSERSRKADDEEIRRWAEALEDPKPSERFAAVKWFAESGDPRAARYLVEASHDRDPRIAARAIDFLGRMQATEAAIPLAERLFMKDASDPLKHQILVALGRIGDTRTSDEILAYLGIARGPELRGAALLALGETGDPSVVEPLTALAESEPDPKLRELAREAIARISGRQATPAGN